MQEMQVWTLGWEDSLEKEMATHSSISLPGKYHRQRRLAGYNPWSCKRIRYNLVTKQQQSHPGATQEPTQSHFIRKKIVISPRKLGEVYESCVQNQDQRPNTSPLTDKWMKKMWNIYTIQYYSVIKRTSCVICRDVDGPRVCHTEWSKSEREKQMSYINTICGIQKNGTDEPSSRWE